LQRFDLVLLQKAFSFRLGMVSQSFAPTDLPGAAFSQPGHALLVGLQVLHDVLLAEEVSRAVHAPGVGFDYQRMLTDLKTTS
jgi:hypothetical protein